MTISCLGNNIRSKNMSYLYGYDMPRNPEGFDIDKPFGYQDAKVKTPAAPVKKAEPPKVIVNEINKQEILNLINSADILVATIYKHLEESTQIMRQEDADDIYGVQDCSATMSKAASEWEKLKRCLNKELELLSPTSKQTDSSLPL